MTPAIYEQIVQTIKTGPQPLRSIYELLRNAGIGWTESQLRLFLECMDGVELVAGADGTLQVRAGERTAQEELAEAIIEIVRSFGGRPAPPSEIRRRLAGRFVTTDEQIRALARKTPGLEIYGPGLLRIRSC